MTRAAIAIGSNSTRLLAADRVGEHLENIFRGREETRLFAGLDAKGNIPPEKLEETARAVERLYHLARQRGAEGCALLATSASRDAKNADALEQRIFSLTGLSMRVISGEEEARLAFRAAAGLERRLVVDVGGGSTELTLGEGGRLQFAVSAQLGASRLRARQEIACPGDAEAALRIAEEILKPYTERVLLLPPAKGLTGLGGSCTTAAAIQAGREMHGEAVEGITVSLETLKKQLALLSGLPMEARMRVPGLPPGRAGIMPHGLCILIAALTLLKMDRFTVSGKTNLDGYLLELPE